MPGTATTRLHSSSPSPNPLWWVLVGLGLRFVLLFLAGDLDPQADERNYVYLALSWNRFGFLGDTGRFLWPPAYPWVLAQFLDGFGLWGLFLVRVSQVLFSGVIGATTILLAKRLFSRPAATVTGLLWSIHLPLIMFSHTHWAETLYLALLLPSFYLLLVWLQEPQQTRKGPVLLVFSGLLFGLALLVKEVALLLPVLLIPLIIWRSSGVGDRGAGLRNVALYVLSIVVVVLPWSLRNLEVYGRFVPAGMTVGENAYWGLNGLYRNFDLATQDSETEELTRTDHLDRWFVAWEPGSAWKRAGRQQNVVDRNRENLRRGLRYAGEHPGWFLRTRIRKLADWLTPLSFFVRHHARETYAGVLASPWVKRPMLVLAMATTVLLLLLSIPGFVLSLRDPTAKWLLGAYVGYFAATGLLVSMSRFRLPAEPILLVLMAGFLSDPGVFRRAHKRTVAICWALWIGLIALWLIALPDTLDQLGRAWS